MGLCNAPSIFQRLVNKELAHMEDGLLHSSTFEKGTEVLRLVLTEFKKAGVTLRLS